MKELYIIEDKESQEGMAFPIRLTEEQVRAIEWFIDVVAVNNEFTITSASDYDYEVKE